MTDNEIIKALECCRDDERYDTCEYCLKCPVSNYNLDEETEAVNCVDALLTRAIDLIKRKDAENERLQRIILSDNTKLEVLQEAKEQLEKDVFNADMNRDSIAYEYELLKQETLVVKSEAIKEFA